MKFVVRLFFLFLVVIAAAVIFRAPLLEFVVPLYINRQTPHTLKVRLDTVLTKQLPLTEPGDEYCRRQ